MNSTRATQLRFRAAQSQFEIQRLGKPNLAHIDKVLKMALAMAAGVSKTLWIMDNVVALINAAAPATKRGPYKKRGAQEVP